ncbi:TRAP transporter small permease [Pseudooceanicola pacificus]|nr:TRAP transporter small permease subunit [Pseudooceanicola pacificus]
MMNTWDRFSSRMNKALTVTGACLILAIAIGITAEILLRKIFNETLGGMDELASYGFAIFTALAFSVAALARANIRIDVLRSWCPRPARVALDLLAQIALIAFAGFLTWRATLLVGASWAKGTTAITPLATPVAWPQSVWLAALWVFVTILCVMFGLSVRALLRGDDAALATLAAPVGELDELAPQQHTITEALTTGAKEA